MEQTKDYLIFLATIISGLNQVNNNIIFEYHNRILLPFHQICDIYDLLKFQILTTQYQYTHNYANKTISSVINNSREKHLKTFLKYNDNNIL